MRDSPDSIKNGDVNRTLAESSDVCGKLDRGNNVRQVRLGSVAIKSYLLTINNYIFNTSLVLA